MRRRLTSVSCLGEDKRLLTWKCLPGGARRTDLNIDGITTKVGRGAILDDEIGVFVAVSLLDVEQITPTSSWLLSKYVQVNSYTDK